jgi:hypothetical protein
VNAHAYSRDIVVLQIVVSVWLAGWVLYSLGRVARGDRRTILFVQFVFFFFFGVPQVLDLFVGAPEYDYQRGFQLSQFDDTTNLVYLAYLAAVPPLLNWFGGRPRAAAEIEALGSMEMPQWGYVASMIALALLPVVLVLAPDPDVYLRYAYSVGHGSNESYHLLVTLVSTLAVIAAVLIITGHGVPMIARLAASPFLAVAVWVHGKRSAVALALLLMLYLLWVKGSLRGRRFIVAAFGVAMTIGVFSYFYQTQIREIGGGGPSFHETFAESDLYVNYRIDFGRDGVAKQTIFAELNPERITILEYRGQSVLFNATFFVPRRFWPGKPYPYAVYATAAMFRIPPRDIGWGITTSWLEEAIANFGWLGLLIGPLIPAFVCVIGDRHRSPYVALLTVVVSSLMLVLQLAAFLPIFLLWAGLIIRGRVTGR